MQTPLCIVSSPYQSKSYTEHRPLVAHLPRPRPPSTWPGLLIFIFSGPVSIARPQRILHSRWRMSPTHRFRLPCIAHRDPSGPEPCHPLFPYVQHSKEPGTWQGHRSWPQRAHRGVPHQVPHSQSSVPPLHGPSFDDASLHLPCGHPPVPRHQPRHHHLAPPCRRCLPSHRF